MRDNKNRFAITGAILAIGLCLLTFQDAFSNIIGQAAVQTLVLPIGARPTAMGEAFTGLANDANAIFYNPAGLGQPPLTVSWKTHINDSAIIAVAARSATTFGEREYVWAATHGGIMRFNRKIWERGEVYLPEDNESLRSVAGRYFVDSEDGDAINEAIWEIRKANRLGMRRFDKLSELLDDNIALFTADTTPFNPREYAKMLMLLPPNESVPGHIATQVLPQSIDAATRVQLAEQIVAAMEIEDRGIARVTELTIPFSIAIRDTVTTMTIDASERLWIGTVSGLWRYHNNRWQRFTTADGLPSDRITAVSVSQNGNVAVATEIGLAILSGTEWRSFTSEDGLPDNYVTSVAFLGVDNLFVGTPRGLARIRGDEIVTFDTASGLLSSGVTALLADAGNRLWIGGDNGITIHSGRNWTRYRFPGSTVYAFAEQSNGTVWIGTNKGVVTHKDGKPQTGPDGRTVTVPEWKTYHSKNALKNDQVNAIIACNKDMWVATDGALHQYAHAGTQVLLFYEQLLPAFGFPELWHAFPAIVIPTEEWGTIGISLNFTNLGDNEQWDELERFLGRARSWEAVFGLSYGFQVRENLSLGLSAKYIHSALDPAEGGVGRTFAVDVGMLRRNWLVNGLDMGFMLQNMGPKIYYLTPEEADPIPFSLRLGLAYRPIQTPFHELTLVADTYREVVKNHYDKPPDPFYKALWTGMLNNEETSFKEEVQMINVSLGLEYMYADFMALRSGYLIDYIGERFELSMGLGIKYANLNVDVSYVYSPVGFMGGFIRAVTGNKDKDGASGARDGQWRVSFLFGL